MKTIERSAKQFATKAHAGQQRKYTGEPYIKHPAEVVELVRSVPHTEAMLAAAWLHDVIEDTPIRLEDIEQAFGKEVADLVDDLTDVSHPSDGNRRKRKHLDLLHTAKTSPAAKTIKLADLISNTRSIVAHDPEFARVYLTEKAALMKVLTEGDPVLYSQAGSFLS